MNRTKKYIFAILYLIFSMSCTTQEKAGSDKALNTIVLLTQKADPIKGIFSFGKGGNFPNTASLRMDYIAGMSSIFSWESMEPQEGQYNFSEIEREIEWASKNKKILNICLYAGNRSPSWLREKNIQMIYWKSDLREDQAKVAKASQNIESAPAFWDATYLSFWKKFVSVLAAKYKDNQTIGYITITGPTPKDLSTGTVIKHDDDWKKIVDIGYTHEKHLSAWKIVVDHFTKEFPNKALVIALGPLRPGGSSSLQLSEEVVNYVIDKKYSNVHFLCVILNDTWFKTSPMSIRLRNLYKKAQQNGHPFGYQMLYSSQRMDKFQNEKNKIIIDYSETLSIALEDGASWIEIWHDDIIDPKFKSEGNPNLKYAAAIKNAALEFLKPTYKQ